MLKNSLGVFLTTQSNFFFLILRSFIQNFGGLKGWLTFNPQIFSIKPFLMYEVKLRYEVKLNTGSYFQVFLLHEFFKHVTAFLSAIGTNK